MVFFVEVAVLQLLALRMIVLPSACCVYHSQSILLHGCNLATYLERSSLLIQERKKFDCDVRKENNAILCYNRELFTHLYAT